MEPQTSNNARIASKRRTKHDVIKMTFHNHIVDSVIRTIRNGIGNRKRNDAQLAKIIDYYIST